jgi:hypothetical protein
MVVYGYAPFAGRKCYDHAYPSETTPGAFRLYDTGQAIANNLASRFVLLDKPFPDHPKGMHHKTYAAKRAKWARMTAPARSMMSAMLYGDALQGWFDDDEIWEANCLKNEQRVNAQMERVDAYDTRYWEDKPTPARGVSAP